MRRRGGGQAVAGRLVRGDAAAGRLGAEAVGVAGRPEFVQDGGDGGEGVAAAPQRCGVVREARFGGGVAAVSGGRFAVRAEQTVVFPEPQGGRPDAHGAGREAGREGGRCGVRHRGEGVVDRGQLAAFPVQPGVAGVEHGERGLLVTIVEGTQPARHAALPRCPVPSGARSLRAGPSPVAGLVPGGDFPAHSRADLRRYRRNLWALRQGGLIDPVGRHPCERKAAYEVRARNRGGRGEGRAGPGG